MKRFFLDKCPQANFALVGAEHMHLSKVLRCREGDGIMIACGDEFDYQYKIEKINKHETRLSFLVRTINTANPQAKLTVFLANIKPDAVSLVTQKLTELGACELVLFNSARCNVQSVNLPRLRSVSEQSCKQCGRSIPLSIAGPISFAETLNRLQGCTAFFADESGTELPNLSNVTFEPAANAAIVIGPEGGFLKEERGSLAAAATPVTLGKRILRAETAAIAGAAILLSRMGE